MPRSAQTQSTGCLGCSSAIKPDASAGALREYADRNSSRAIGNFTLMYKIPYRYVAADADVRYD